MNEESIYGALLSLGTLVGRERERERVDYRSASVIIFIVIFSYQQNLKGVY